MNSKRSPLQHKNGGLCLTVGCVIQTTSSICPKSGAGHHTELSSIFDKWLGNIQFPKNLALLILCLPLSDCLTIYSYIRDCMHPDVHTRVSYKTSCDVPTQRDTKTTFHSHNYIRKLTKLFC